MNRFSLVVGCAALGIAVLVIASKRADSSAVDALVRLQASTPGTQQVGHANVSGTMKAGQFQGDGAGLTGVNADLLDGINSSSFLQSVPMPLLLSGNNNGGAIVRGENVSGIDNSAGIMGVSSSPTGQTRGVLGTNSSNNGSGVAGLSQGTFGAGVWGENTATTGDAHGVFGRTFSDTGMGVRGQALAFSGANFGGHFVSFSSAGTGVYGSAGASSGSTNGGLFTASSPDGRGVRGVASATTGLAVGGRFSTASSAGIGAWGSATATGGVNYGVYGESASTSGRGVFGYASASSGLAHGVWGQTASINGNGVVGQATAASGTTFGVVGESLSPTGVSVYGSHPDPNGWAVYATGNLGASGTKSFRIDHPTDPTHKYLLHYCAEGPEPRNVYQGQVTTGADGYAWVSLPDYYQEINKDPLIQLTVVDASDDFVQVKVSKRVTGNRFQVRTSKGNVEVNWRVDAVRNDRWVQRNGAPIEVEKTGRAKGKYQHPEFYGATPEMGEFFSPQRHEQIGKSLQHP